MEDLTPDRIKEFAEYARWYHTIEIAPGIYTTGVFDHRPYLANYEFPKTLEEKTVIDIGASDGFFAFEFEARGASSVLAVDTNFFDGSLAIEPSPSRSTVYQKKYEDIQSTNMQFVDVYKSLDVPAGHQFLAAKELRNAQKVDYRTMSIYNLDTLDQKFDLVFCGDLIEHLKNPLFALENMVKITKEICIISLSGIPSAWNPSEPKSDCGDLVEYVGHQSGGSFFHFYPHTFENALYAAGFSRVNRKGHFDLLNNKIGTYNRRVIFHCYP